MSQKLTINGLPVSYQIALSADADIANATPFQDSPYFYNAPNGGPFIDGTDYYFFPRDPLTPDFPIVGERIRYHEETPGNATITLQSATDNGARSTHDVVVRTIAATNPPAIDPANASLRIAGYLDSQSDKVVGGFTVAELAAVIGKAQQVTVDLIRFIDVACYNLDSTTPVPTLAPFGPFAWQVGVAISVQLPVWQNGTGVLSLSGLPPGISYFVNLAGVYFLTGTPTAVATGAVVFTNTYNGATYTGIGTFAVNAAAVTPFTLIAPLYDCQTGLLTFKTMGGDNSAAQFYIPGVLPQSTVGSVTVPANIRNDVNSAPLQITGFQSGVSSAYVFDFHGFCASTPITVISPAVVHLNATVGVPFSYPLGAFTDVNGNVLTGMLTLNRVAAGMNVDPNTRVLSGTPQVVGVTNFDINFLYQGHYYQTQNNDFVSNSPQPGIVKALGRFFFSGGYASHDIPIQTTYQPAGTVPQVGVQLYNPDQSSQQPIYWFDTTALSNGTDFNFHEGHGVSPLYSAGSYIDYFLRLNSASATLFYYRRDIANTPANQAADFTVAYTASSTYSSPEADYIA